MMMEGGDEMDEEVEEAVVRSEATSTTHPAGATPTKRKRQKLTHLTEEEKMMRRKLKNRMAAQSARDRKKAQMDDLEKLVLRLEKQNAALMKENQNLRATLNNNDNNNVKVVQKQQQQQR